METPFVFGRIADGADFTNREEETKQLINYFSSGTNTVLISPRRWGKSSLVKKASRKVEKLNKKLFFCFIDLFNVRSEEQFYQLLAQEVIKASSSKNEERIENIKHFMSRFIPKITYSPLPESELSIGLDWKEIKKHPDEILNLAENISKNKKIKIIICIDEFQNISSFENPLAFQKKLRSHWQQHKLTSYCLYGSKRNMMLEVFASQSMPFYKFGNLMFLKKIDSSSWQKFIVQRFADTGKKISPQSALLIAQLTDNHPYYVQQLAQQTWLRTNKTCTEHEVNQAFEGLIMQLGLLFQNITDSLTSLQINFLKALIEEAGFLSAKSTLTDYHLGSSANVIKARGALVNKEIIDVQTDGIYFVDPVYKEWLKKNYFS